MKYLRTLAILSVCILMVSTISQARDFRSKRIIKTPFSKSQPAIQGDVKGSKITRAIKIDRQLIQQAYQTLFKAWGTAEMDQMLSDNFTNRQQLLNAVADGVPLDAKLRMISMDSIRVLSQQRLKGQDAVASIITAEITTQITYQDAQLGYQKIDGTGEYIIELVTQGHNL